MSMSRFARAPREASYVGCSTHELQHPGHKKQMKYHARVSSGRIRRWETDSRLPQEMEEHLSKRIDSDKIVFSPRLNRVSYGSFAERADGRSDPTATALSEHPQSRSVHRRETAGISRASGARSLFRGSLAGASRRSRAWSKNSPPPLTAARCAKCRTCFSRSSAQYRAAHKRYSQIHGFNSYANRSTIAHTHRQQNAL